ncbi:MAG: hypothetical protein ACRDRR_16110 [Pseudonocardiaceae bacterium]
MTTMLLDRPDPIRDDLTRRRLLGAGLGAGVGLALTGCTSNEPAAAPSASPTAEAGWSFTDDRGTTVSLPARPQRIAAYEIAAGPLRFLGAPVVAVFGGRPLDQSAHLDGLDLAGISSAGAVIGEVNYEVLIELEVDLIVTLFNADQPAVFGFNDAPAQAKAERIAPIVALDGTEDRGATMTRFVDLASSVGADQQAPALSAARRRYTDAQEAMRAATAAKPGLRALAIRLDPQAGTVTFIGPYELYPQLQQFADLGLDLAEFTGGRETASLEEISKYRGDLLLVDAFSNLPAVAELPLWTELPAVKAGQTVPFQPLARYRHDQVAAEIEAVVAAVRAANAALVP